MAARYSPLSCKGDDDLKAGDKKAGFGMRKKAGRDDGNKKEPFDVAGQGHDVSQDDDPELPLKCLLPHLTPADLLNLFRTSRRMACLVMLHAASSKLTLAGTPDAFAQLTRKRLLALQLGGEVSGPQQLVLHRCECIYDPRPSFLTRLMRCFTAQPEAACPLPAPFAVHRLSITDTKFSHAVSLVQLGRVQTLHVGAWVAAEHACILPSYVQMMPALRQLTCTPRTWSPYDGTTSGRCFKELFAHSSLRVLRVPGLLLDQDSDLSSSACNWEELVLDYPYVETFARLPLDRIPRCIVRGGVTVSNTYHADYRSLDDIQHRPGVIIEPTLGHSLAPGTPAFMLCSYEPRSSSAAHLRRLLAVLGAKHASLGTLVLQWWSFSADMLTALRAIPPCFTVLGLEGCQGLPDDPSSLFSSLPLHITRVVKRGRRQEPESYLRV